MMQTSAIIPTSAAHWQPSLLREGALVEGVHDIDQAIRITLSTPVGSDAHRPQFGCRIHDYIDWPITRARPHIVREIVAALNRWEPRMRIIRIRWKAADGVIQQTQVHA